MVYTISGGASKDILAGDLVKVVDGILPRSVDSGELVPVVAVGLVGMIQVSVIPDGYGNYLTTDLTTTIITEVWRKQ